MGQKSGVNFVDEVMFGGCTRRSILFWNVGRQGQLVPLQTTQSLRSLRWYEKHGKKCLAVDRGRSSLGLVNFSIWLGMKR